MDNISEPSKQDIARAMIVYGGGFFSNLGLALQSADTNNTAKIKETWPDEWEQYKQFAIMMKERTQ